MTIKNFLSTTVLFVALSVPAQAAMCGFFGFGCNPQLETKIVTEVNYFVPAFEQVSVVTQTTRGEYVVPANDTYFATAETAQVTAQKFGALRVEFRNSIQNLGANYLYNVGPNKGTPANYRVLIFGPGTILKNNTGDVIGVVTKQFEINAGVLADYYRRMPEKNFPAYTQVFGKPAVETHFLSLAEQYVWRVLEHLNPSNGAYE